MRPVHALDAVPLFPLPGHVLLPGLPVPFLIFEPRYRALVSDLMALPPAARWLAVPRITPGFEGAAAGEPPVVSIVSAARLANARELPDGLWQIAVIGEGRWYLHEQPSERPYRRAQLLRRPEPTFTPDLTDRIGGAVRRLLGLRSAVTDEVIALLDPGRHEPNVVLDRLASLCLVDPDLRQRYLEAESPCCRMRVIEGAQCCSGEVPSLN